MAAALDGHASDVLVEGKTGKARRERNRPITIPRLNDPRLYVQTGVRPLVGTVVRQPFALAA